MTEPFVLVTGATGTLGRELMARMVRRGLPMAITTRAKADETPAAARARLAALLEDTDPGIVLGEAEVAFADVTQPSLGLAPETLARLESGERAVQIVHGASELRFDQPWDVMEKENVLGTENVLDLARRFAESGKLARLDYVSTAYVAGDRRGLCREDEIDVGQGHRNEYERSKRIAELSVDRARKQGLPVAVHRPSIIVGDSRSGRAAAFKVLYWPLKLYARGQWKTVFGRADCPMDVVPVDYVADAMMHLMFDPRAIGRTMHLAAGPQKQATIGELVALIERHFKRGKVRYVDPDLYMKLFRPLVLPLIKIASPGAAERGRVFLPYLTSNPTFAVDVAKQLLEGTGLSPPRVADYFAKIMRYAETTDFGRTLAVA